MSLHDLIERANSPQVAVPTTTTAATVGLLSASEWLTLLSICVVVMQLIIALPRFVSTLKSGVKWIRGKGGSEDGKATRLVPAAMMALAIAAAPFIAGWEGKTNHAIIPVPGDVPTICHGHTKTAALGQVKTDAECEALLQQDLGEALYAVARHVHDIDMPETRWIALASFVFNVGEGAFAQSTALQKINAGDITGGCEALATKHIDANGVCRGYGCGWAAGKMLKGLQRRRIAERNMCLQPPPPPVVAQAEPPWWKFWARWS